jgi:hypothetical protein
MNTKLLKHRPDPNCLSCTISKNLILCLFIGMRNCGLLVRTPRHEIRPKKNSVTTSGSSIIRTPSPISIGGRSLLNKQAYRHSTLTIPKSSLNNLIMRSGRLRQKLANLVDNKQNIRPGQCQILKATNQTTITDRILILEW